MQIFVYSVERLNSPVYSAPPCTYRTTVDRPPLSVDICLQSAYSSKPAARHCCGRRDRQTDGQQTLLLGILCGQSDDGGAWSHARHLIYYVGMRYRSVVICKDNNYCCFMHDHSF